MDWQPIWIALAVLWVCTVLVACWALFCWVIEDDEPSPSPAADWQRAREEVYAPMIAHLSREAPQSTERPPAPDPTLGAPCRYRRLSGERCPVCEARE